MNPRLRNTAALLGVTGMVALGAGCGTDDTSGVAASGSQSANAAETLPGDQSGTGSAPAPGTAPDDAAPGGAPDFSALAAKLGVSESKLQSAMEAARPQPGTAPTANPFAKLADQLGLSEAKVRAAMQAVMPQMGPPPSSGGAPAPSGAAAETTTS